jgi:hypothetical protein
MAAAPLARRLRAILLWGLVALVAALGLYGWLSLRFEYSNGERAGVLQKFSRRGWVCKTYEGELALYVVAGVQPEVWNFTVRDQAVADKLLAAVGERVQLHYAEHRGVPSSCFGDTAYFVDGITAIAPHPPGAQPAVP